MMPAGFFPNDLSSHHSTFSEINCEEKAPSMPSTSTWKASGNVAPDDDGSNGDRRTSGEATGSGSRERKWDDPPEKPPPLVGPTTTMILVKKNKFDAHAAYEIEQIEFTRNDGLLVVRTTSVSNNVTSALDPASSVFVYEVSNLRQRVLRPLPYNGHNIRGNFALSQGPGAPAVAFATLDAHRRLEVYDLPTDKRRLKADLQIQAPVAYTPDACYVATVSKRDPSRIAMVDVRNIYAPKMLQHIAVHTSPITHMAVTPDGTAIVSASQDGSLRMTSLQTGRTLRKAQVEARGPATMLQLSDDGDLVASVWGRHVYLWKLKVDQMGTFNLDVVRQTEGWPLAISPDCRHLVCRTEDGLDVVDLETGFFLADYPVDPGQPLITAAAVSHNGRWITIGDYDGRVTVLEVVTPTC